MSMYHLCIIMIKYSFQATTPERNDGNSDQRQTQPFERNSCRFSGNQYNNVPHFDVGGNRYAEIVPSNAEPRDSFTFERPQSCWPSNYNPIYWKSANTAAFLHTNPSQNVRSQSVQPLEYQQQRPSHTFQPSNQSESQFNLNSNLNQMSDQESLSNTGRFESNGQVTQNLHPDDDVQYDNVESSGIPAVESSDTDFNYQNCDYNQQTAILTSSCNYRPIEGISQGERSVLTNSTVPSGFSGYDDSLLPRNTNHPHSNFYYSYHTKNTPKPTNSNRQHGFAPSNIYTNTRLPETPINQQGIAYSQVVESGRLTHPKFSNTRNQETQGHIVSHTVANSTNSCNLPLSHDVPAHGSEFTRYTPFNQLQSENPHLNSSNRQDNIQGFVYPSYPYSNFYRKPYFDRPSNRMNSLGGYGQDAGQSIYLHGHSVQSNHQQRMSYGNLGASDVKRDYFLGSSNTTHLQNNATQFYPPHTFFPTNHREQYHYMGNNPFSVKPEALEHQAHMNTQPANTNQQNYQGGIDQSIPTTSWCPQDSSTPFIPGRNISENHESLFQGVQNPAQTPQIHTDRAFFISGDDRLAIHYDPHSRMAFPTTVNTGQECMKSTAGMPSRLTENSLQITYGISSCPINSHGGHSSESTVDQGVDNSQDHSVNPQHDISIPDGYTSGNIHLESANDVDQHSQEHVLGGRVSSCGNSVVLAESQTSEELSQSTSFSTSNSSQNENRHDPDIPHQNTYESSCSVQGPLSNNQMPLKKRTVDPGCISNNQTPLLAVNLVESYPLDYKTLETRDKDLIYTSEGSRSTYAFDTQTDYSNNQETLQTTSDTHELSQRMAPAPTRSDETFKNFNDSQTHSLQYGSLNSNNHINNPQRNLYSNQNLQRFNKYEKYPASRLAQMLDCVLDIDSHDTSSLNKPSESNTLSATDPCSQTLLSSNTPFFADSDTRTIEHAKGANHSKTDSFIQNSSTDSQYKSLYTDDPDSTLNTPTNSDSKENTTSEMGEISDENTFSNPGFVFLPEQTSAHCAEAKEIRNHHNERFPYAPDTLCAKGNSSSVLIANHPREFSVECDNALSQTTGCVKTQSSGVIGHKQGFVSFYVHPQAENSVSLTLDPAIRTLSDRRSGTINGEIKGINTTSINKLDGFSKSESLDKDSYTAHARSTIATEHEEKSFTIYQNADNANASFVNSNVETGDVEIAGECIVDAGPVSQKDLTKSESLVSSDVSVQTELSWPARLSLNFDLLYDPSKKGTLSGSKNSSQSTVKQETHRQRKRIVKTNKTGRKPVIDYALEHHQDINQYVQESSNATSLSKIDTQPIDCSRIIAIPETQKESKSNNHNYMNKSLEVVSTQPLLAREPSDNTTNLLKYLKGLRIFRGEKQTPQQVSIHNESSERCENPAYTSSESSYESTHKQNRNPGIFLNTQYPENLSKDHQSNRESNQSTTNAHCSDSLHKSQNVSGRDSKNSHDSKKTMNPDRASTVFCDHPYFKFSGPQEISEAEESSRGLDTQSTSQKNSHDIFDCDLGLQHPHLQNLIGSTQKRRGSVSIGLNTNFRDSAASSSFANPNFTASKKSHKKRQVSKKSKTPSGLIKKDSDFVEKISAVSVPKKRKLESNNTSDAKKSRLQPENSKKTTKSRKTNVNHQTAKTEGKAKKTTKRSLKSERKSKQNNEKDTTNANQAAKKTTTFEDVDTEDTKNAICEIKNEMQILASTNDAESSINKSEMAAFTAKSQKRAKKEKRPNWFLCPTTSVPLTVLPESVIDGRFVLEDSRDKTDKPLTRSASNRMKRQENAQ